MNIKTVAIFAVIGLVVLYVAYTIVSNVKYVEKLTVVTYTGEIDGSCVVYTSSVPNSSAYSGFINGEYNGTLYDYSSTSGKREALTVSGKLWGNFTGELTGTCVGDCTRIAGKIKGIVTNASFEGIKETPGLGAFTIPIGLQVLVGAILLLLVLNYIGAIDIVRDWLRISFLNKSAIGKPYSKWIDEVKTFVVDEMHCKGFEKVLEIEKDNEYDPTQYLFLVQLSRFSNNETIIVEYYKRRYNLVAREASYSEWKRRVAAVKELNRLVSMESALKKGLETGRIERDLGSRRPRDTLEEPR